MSAFRTDPTTYTIADLRAEPRNSRSPEGEHIRAFQMMARRLSQRPEVAGILIHKPGRCLTTLMKILHNTKMSSGGVSWRFLVSPAP